MGLDLALVRFPSPAGAESAFGTMRERAGDAEPWTHEVALVERHRNGRIALRGTFAGHYVNVDQEDHFSEPGAGIGAITGAVVGALFLGGPAGLAPGLVVGAAVGAARGHADAGEPEPEALVEELRSSVPAGTSAIVLLAEPAHVDRMLELVPSSREVVRRSLSIEEAAKLAGAVVATPMASQGPTVGGSAG